MYVYFVRNSNKSNGLRNEHNFIVFVLCHIFVVKIISFDWDSQLILLDTIFSLYFSIYNLNIRLWWRTRVCN